MCVKEFHNKFKCAYVHHAFSFVAFCLAFCRCIVLILLYTGAFTGSATQDITSSAPKVSFVCTCVSVCACLVNVAVIRLVSLLINLLKKKTRFIA